MAEVTRQSLGMQRRLQLERQSGREMQASRDARVSGDSYSAGVYKAQAQRTIKQAHPLKGDRKT